MKLDHFGITYAHRILYSRAFLFLASIRLTAGNGTRYLAIPMFRIAYILPGQTKIPGILKFPCLSQDDA